MALGLYFLPPLASGTSHSHRQLIFNDGQTSLLFAWRHHDLPPLSSLWRGQFSPFLRGGGRGVPQLIEKVLFFSFPSCSREPFFFLEIALGIFLWLRGLLSFQPGLPPREGLLRRFYRGVSFLLRSFFCERAVLLSCPCSPKNVTNQVPLPLSPAEE